MDLEDLQDIAQEAGIDLEGITEREHAIQRILAHDESMN